MGNLIQYEFYSPPKNNNKSYYDEGFNCCINGSSEIENQYSGRYRKIWMDGYDDALLCLNSEHEHYALFL